MFKNPAVKSFLSSIVDGENGDENLAIIDCLVEGIATDEEIAEKTGIRLNLVRKVLYRLHDSGLATYKRSKDPETQWYSYTWEFKQIKVNAQIREKGEELINSLKNSLEKEENSIYFTCNEEHRFDFDLATSNGFICPDCGEELIGYDNSKDIEEIKTRIRSYKSSFNKFLTENAK